VSIEVAVIYYSATGNVARLAQEVARGVEEGGATARVRRVAETAPREAIEGNDAWREHVDNEAPKVPEATLADLVETQGFAFGTPTRFGTPSAQLKSFIDTAGGPWSQGQLADKAATSFTSAQNLHGGNESTLLALNNVFYHWGSIIVPPGYTDELLYSAGGNPYGTSYPSGSGEPVSDEVAAAARHQGKRLARVAAQLAG
jgi:NAD(P)H dehydrogenase (quinone)